MRKKHIYSDINNNFELFAVLYPRGNNNARKMRGEPMKRRVHLYEERRKSIANSRKELMAKYGCYI